MSDRSRTARDGSSARTPRSELSRRGFFFGSLALVSVTSLTANADPRVDAVIDASVPRIALKRGRSFVEVRIPARAFVSIAVFGPAEALLGFDLLGGALARELRSNSPLDEDGLLPRVVSLQPSDEQRNLVMMADLSEPAEVAMALAAVDDTAPPSPRGLRDGKERARPLVGMPPPTRREDGYVLQVPARYAFARIDVVMMLRKTFAKVMKRYPGEPIGVGDISQWNGRRPKSDRGEPRHISHAGGVDVDLGLPANDTLASTLRDHCRGVLIDPQRYGCAPGSAKGVDYDRLAYVLGTICDEAPGTLTKVFVDDAYRREIVLAGQRLGQRRQLKADALTALGEDGIVVASPWHTDHMHLRFSGEPGRAPFET